MRPWFLFCLCIMLSPFAFAKPAHQTITDWTLGGTKVQIVNINHGKGKHFVHLHQNESTALRAAKTYITQHGGSLVTLKHKGERNIHFVLRHQKYAFDPNRIFSDKGIKQTLKKHGYYSHEALVEVKLFARQILRKLPYTKVIAVHNNKEYSLKAYLPKHALRKDAKIVKKTARYSYRNFYLVTQREDFVRLKRKGFNVVYQSPQAKEDGSLSKYFSRYHYVNVECAYDAPKLQLRMIQAI